MKARKNIFELSRTQGSVYDGDIVGLGNRAKQLKPEDADRLYEQMMQITPAEQDTKQAV